MPNSSWKYGYKWIRTESYLDRTFLPVRRTKKNHIRLLSQQIASTKIDALLHTYHANFSPTNSNGTQHFSHKHIQPHPCTARKHTVSRIFPGKYYSRVHARVAPAVRTKKFMTTIHLGEPTPRHAFIYSISARPARSLVIATHEAATVCARAHTQLRQIKDNIDREIFPRRRARHDFCFFFLAVSRRRHTRGEAERESLVYSRAYVCVRARAPEICLSSIGIDHGLLFYRRAGCFSGAINFGMRLLSRRRFGRL